MVPRIKAQIGRKFKGQTSDKEIRNETNTWLKFRTYAGWEAGDIDIEIPPQTKIKLVGKGTPHCCAILEVVPL